jgi:peroxiredoxin Q/BCP
VERIAIGQAAPDFELLDQDCMLVRLSDFAGRKVLLYFYPKADTPSCTQQACNVNLSLHSLESKGMVAMGISPDTCESLKSFAEKFSLHFPLLSDPEHKVAQIYGAWGQRHRESGDYEGIVRSSFVIDEDGKIIQSNYDVSPAETILRAEQLLMMY